LSSSWATMIKGEIIDLKLRMTALEAAIREASGAVSGTKEFGGEVDESGFPTGPVKLIGFDKDIKSTAQELVEATYTIKSAAIAMRGYLMLLDQAGLSRDQKKMIREIEYGMMMVMKLAQTIKILMTAELFSRAAMGDPTAFLQIGIAGGYLASSLAYGSKVSGGGV
jgi:hypothetical protein